MFLLERGRMIAVSGMAKSGHIARKIAAVFASTGSISYFIHPDESAHGDLGMLGRDDALILISNSGALGELTPLIQLTQQANISIIAMTANPENSPAKKRILF